MASGGPGSAACGRSAGGSTEWRNLLREGSRRGRHDAFLSFWCFFAPLTSLRLGWGFAGLTERGRAARASSS